MSPNLMMCYVFNVHETINNSIEPGLRMSKQIRFVLVTATCFTRNKPQTGSESKTGPSQESRGKRVIRERNSPARPPFQVSDLFQIKAKGKQPPPLSVPFFYPNTEHIIIHSDPISLSLSLHRPLEVALVLCIPSVPRSGGHCCW